MKAIVEAHNPRAPFATAEVNYGGSHVYRDRQCCQGYLRLANYCYFCAGDRPNTLVLVRRLPDACRKGQVDSAVDRRLQTLGPLRRPSEEHAHNGPRPRERRLRVPPSIGAAGRGLCAFKALKRSTCRAAPECSRYRTSTQWADKGVALSGFRNEEIC
jgi:hypothetical protein